MDDIKLQVDKVDPQHDKPPTCEPNMSAAELDSLLVDNGEHEATGMTVALTLGAGTVNAMTYRSYVDPQEARPDLAYYGDKHARERRSRAGQAELNDSKFKMRSSRADGALSGKISMGVNFGNFSAQDKEDLKTVPAEQVVEESLKKAPKKFGTWDGVFTSCLLNIFGVIMFLRLGWVVGQGGIFSAIGIILISTIVTTLTTLSMSAICTNGEIKGGGAYYLVSRAIGPKVGGAVGFLFTIGLTVAIAMYIIGFAETLVAQLEPVAGYMITGDRLWDIRIWGLIVLFIIFVMALIGTDWVIKLQLG